MMRDQSSRGRVRGTRTREDVMRTSRWLAAAAPAAAAAAVVAYVRWLRPWQMHWGATDEEVARRLPGDELVGRPHWNATRAVTVAATPEQIWPWLLQLGWGRAGWYGYDWVDNGGRPSAWALLPEHQHLEVGKDFPMSPFTSMYCVAFEEPRWMLWRGRPEVSDPSGPSADLSSGPVPESAGHAQSAGDAASGDRAQRFVTSGGTWVWYLEPADERHTRLITRMRDQYRWTSPVIATQLAVDVFDFPFMRKVLLGIKERAEALARGEVFDPR
jgi:hypothetical protein